MNKVLVVLLASVACSAAAIGATPSDITTPIHQFIDGLNSGDTKSAFAAYAGESISITDEFAPHIWVGRTAPQDWASEYNRHTQAVGISDGLIKYGEPTRIEIERDLAYVVNPMVYSYNEHGKKTQEDGQMTFVLHRGPGGWKIKAWTWTGSKPHLL